MNSKTSFRSIREEVSPEEWQARVDLAARHLLINLYGLLYKEITASSLVKITLDGDIV